MISELEVLNASLQKNTQTVEGMLSAVSLVQESLKSKRNTEHFEAVFKEAGDMCDNLSLETIVPPRTHRLRDILGRLLHTHLDQPEFSQSRVLPCPHNFHCCLSVISNKNPPMAF